MALADGVSFVASSGGTGTFAFGQARPSFLTLSQAVTDGELTDGQTVSYLAQDSLGAPTLREWGHGTFSAAGAGSIARTSVLGGTSGVGVAVNFPSSPVVSLTALAEDLLCEVSTPPSTDTSSGAPFEFAFDGSGNLYICYQANTWAKFTNVAPFSPSGSYYVWLGF